MESINVKTAEIITEDSSVKAKWKISWGDGYYPYCSNCGKEPNWSIAKFGLPDHCPFCKAEMANTEELNAPLP